MSKRSWMSCSLLEQIYMGRNSLELKIDETVNLEINTTA